MPRLLGVVQSQQGITCPKCGTHNDSDASYCRSCGADLKLAAASRVQQKYCPHCGRPLPSEYAATCPSCGGFLTAYGAQEQAPPAVLQPYPVPQAQPYPQTAWQGSRWGPHDGTALSKIRLFGLIGLIGSIIGITFTIGTSSLNYFSAILSPGTAVVTNAIGASLVLVVILVAVALQFVSIVFGRAAFRSLAGVDGNFRMPLSLSYAMYIGLILLVAGFALVIGALLTTTSTTALGTAEFAAIALGGFVLIGAIVALIIGEVGLLVGVWRFGSRYNEGLFKAAAILYIIPFASVVAPILVYIAAGSVEGRLRQFMPPT